MIRLLHRARRLFVSDSAAKALFAFLVCGTAGLIAFPRGSDAAPSTSSSTSTTSHTNAGSVKLSATLSQTKLVQGTDGTFYTEISIDTPEARSELQARAPIDLVVVLDRSGSMAADNRLPFAKNAIQSALSRLTANDRFGLVTFETQANIVSPLAAVTDIYRSQQQMLVNSITPAGSTNLSGGLELAKQMLSAPMTGRTRKVLLLSDGDANIGITDPSGLGTIARSMSQKETIVSTIGMGLGFNEVVMASLADQGMGNYSYLEHLESLASILQKDLEAARNIYASSSSLQVEIPSGFQLVDSSGYPQEPGRTANSIRLLTGQLFGGQRKTFFLTFRAPTDTVRTIPLGGFELSYTANGRESCVSVSKEILALEIVDRSQAPAAVASIDGDVFRKSWSLNNYGRVQQQMSDEIRRGNAPAAKKLMEKYEAELTSAESASGVALADAESKQKMRELKSTVSDLLASGEGKGGDKANRAAKAIQASAIESQRYSK